jgi:hypothetical protein
MYASRTFIAFLKRGAAKRNIDLDVSCGQLLIELPRVFRPLSTHDPSLSHLVKVSPSQPLPQCYQTFSSAATGATKPTQTVSPPGSQKQPGHAAMILLKARTQQQNERESAQAGKGGSGNVGFTSYGNSIQSRAERFPTPGTAYRSFQGAAHSITIGYCPGSSEGHRRKKEMY